MDPTENLKEQRMLCGSIAVDINKEDPVNRDEANRLVELVQALDEWLCGGGFLPEDWQAGPVTLMRKVKSDTPTFKNISVSVAAYGAYVEVWWHRGADSPNLECNFFDGSPMGFPKARVLATLLTIGGGIAKNWYESPPWERSIA